MENRKFDIVLFGSTGFTGGLVAEYFAANVDLKNIKWAIAGRNAEKLDTVKANLISINAACKNIEILLCNSDDIASLENVTKQTKIIVSTVGPFAVHGETLVEACVNTATNYCDITGEPAFVKSVLKKHNKAAEAKGIYILNCCGFDSIPADAGALFTAMQLPANETKTVRGFVSSNGTFSGGTFASAVGAMADISLFPAKKESSDTSEKTTKTTAVKRIKSNLYFEKTIKKWALPMPVIDPWMVQRTSLYKPTVFGENFEYAQYIALKSLPQTVGLVSAVGALMVGAQIPPLKNLILQYKKSGDGPTAEQRAKSRFKLTFIGESESKKVITTVSGGDPGYTET